MDNSRILRLSQFRRDLETRAQLVLSHVSNDRHGGFSEFLSAILMRDSPNRPKIASAFRLPYMQPRLERFMEFVLENDELSFSSIAGARIFYMLCALHQVMSDPLAPRAWAIHKSVLESNMAICADFLPKRERNWSIIRKRLQDSPNAISDLSQHSGSPYDSTQWALLKTISQKPDVPFEAEDYNLIARELTQYIEHHVYSDNSNKWWTFERYFWAAAHMKIRPDGYEHVRDSFFRFVQDKSSLSRTGKSPSARLLLKEIYTENRTLLFAALDSMAILASTLFIKDEELRQSEGMLKNLIEKAELEILNFADNSNLWWICHKLLLLYNIIRCVTKSEVYEALQKSDLDLREYRIFDRVVYEKPYRQRIEKIAANIDSVLRKSEARNWELSVMILGLPGMGKSTVVQSILYLLNEKSRISAPLLEANLLTLIPDIKFDDVLEKVREMSRKERKRIPVFFDDFHNHVGYNQYSRINPFLTNESNAVPFFAVSNVSSKDEFVQQGLESEEEQQGDFASRIQSGNWLELPSLEYCPLHRIMIYTTHNITDQESSLSISKKRLAYIALSCADIRDCRELKNLKNDLIDEYMRKTQMSREVEDLSFCDWLSLFEGEIHAKLE